MLRDETAATIPTCLPDVLGPVRCPPFSRVCATSAFRGAPDVFIQNRYSSFRITPSLLCNGFITAPPVTVAQCVARPRSGLLRGTMAEGGRASGAGSTAEAHLTFFASSAARTIARRVGGVRAARRAEHSSSATIYF